jgi:hypothetical protein
VENGGGLVMTYSTSLYDDKGMKLNDFALGKLAGIRILRPDVKIENSIKSGKGTSEPLIRIRKNQGVIKSLHNVMIPASRLFETVEVLERGTIVADIVSEPDYEPIAPGIIISNYGRGKVAYISAAIGALYWKSNAGEISDLIREIIQYVSPQILPYELITCKSTLISNMTFSGENRIIHLINRSGSNPPAENVTLKYVIPPGKKIKKVVSFIPADFLQRRKKNALYITFPRIEKYQAVAIEMF